MSATSAQQHLIGMAAALCLFATSGCAGVEQHTKFVKTPKPLPSADTSTAPDTTSLNQPTSSESDVNKPYDSRITRTTWWHEESGGSVLRLDTTSGPSSTYALPLPIASQSRRTLGLRDAINTALMQNPDVVVARAGGPVNDAGRIVAATYPWNPSVQVQVDPYARDIDGNFLDTKNQVSVMQTLELAHQGSFRRQAANASWNQQRAVIAQSEWTATVAAMRAYFDALHRKGLYDLASNAAATQTKMISVMDRRFNAGLATTTERLTASIAARQSQRLAELAEADYQSALNSLRVLLNLSPTDQFELDGNLEAYRWLPVTAALDQASATGNACYEDTSSDDSIRWVSNRADVIAAQFAVSAARANLDLARANMIPNVSTGPTYERDESGTVFFGVAAQMDLPVWNTGCPLVRQRLAEFQQQLITWRQTTARAALQAQAAANRYAVAHRLLDGRRGAKDAGESELSTATSAYGQGQATILEVLSIQDSLIQERKSSLDLLNEIAQAATDLVAALAIDPECLIQAPSKAP